MKKLSKLTLSSKDQRKNKQRGEKIAPNIKKMKGN